MMISGLYYGSRVQIIDSIKSKFANLILVNDTNLSSFKSSYSKFFDLNNLYLHNNPSLSDIKIVSDLIDNNIGNHILVFEDDSFDGRTSLIQKLKKANQIFDFSLPVYGDKSKLNTYLKKYNLPYDVISWIQINCPTVRIKSKSTGRKDIICYDIDLLEQEIVKIKSVKSEVIVDDFIDSEFKSDSDIFQFINDLVDRRLDNVFANYNKLLDHMGEQGLLLVMISQIYFMLRISDVKDHKNIHYIDRIDMRDILGKYYSEDWCDVSYSYQPTNPIRFKLEFDRLSSSFDYLNNILNLLLEALIDMRSGGSKHHCLPLLFCKIALV
jgi:hypothetical protein